MKFCRTHTNSELALGKKSLVGQEAASEIVTKYPEAGPDSEITEEAKVHLWHHVSSI